MFILILWVTSGYSTPATVIPTPFSTIELCNEAKRKIENETFKNKYFIPITGYCMEIK